MAALMCRSRLIHFIPLLWGVLACVAILPSAGYYWNHLEPCGTYTTLEPPGTIWNLYDPRILLDVPYLQYLKCMAALVCRSPPFHTFYSHALGCVGMDLPYPQNLCVTIFTHSPYYWKLLEPPGTYMTLGFSWMCPAPQYLKCMAALMCRPPPFHTFYSHALGCVGMRCHSP